MYTNEILKEKYKAQRELSQKAKKLSKDYLKVIDEEVRELFQKNRWKLIFSDRKGEWQMPSIIPA